MDGVLVVAGHPCSGVVLDFPQEQERLVLHFGAGMEAGEDWSLVTGERHDELFTDEAEDDLDMWFVGGSANACQLQVCAEDARRCADRLGDVDLAVVYDERFHVSER